MPTYKNPPMRTDDAGEPVEADQHAGVAADGVEEIHQRDRRPAQRPSPRHVTRCRGGQRGDAGRDDVEQVGRGQVGHQPVVDGPQQSIAREDDQHEPGEYQRHSSDNSHRACHHHVIIGT